MQNMLNEIGLDAGEADGQYGDTMKAAVKNFQLYAGLSNDGIAGPSTLSALVNSWSGLFPNPISETPSLHGITIGIDADHQRVSNAEQEPLSPGDTNTKDKSLPGYIGTWSGIGEYVINLQVALKLKQELEALGATVVMSRESHDVNISSAERAQAMNDARVDFWITLNVASSQDEEEKGIFMRIPAEGSMDTGDTRVYGKNQRLAQLLIKNVVAATGAENIGIKTTKNNTEFNWSQMPVCQVTMGYLTNEEEERPLITKAYQQKIVNGLIKGIKEYFNAD